MTAPQISALRLLDSAVLVYAHHIDGRTRAALVRKGLIEPTSHKCMRLTYTGRVLADQLFAGASYRTCQGRAAMLAGAA